MYINITRTIVAGYGSPCNEQCYIQCFCNALTMQKMYQFYCNASDKDKVAARSW